MKHEYTIELHQGNHGIWVFVRRPNLFPRLKTDVIFEQAGVSLEEALVFAKAVIEAEEKNPQ